MNFPSREVENAVNAFAGLPGVGKKTALRLVLHLLKQNKLEIQQFGKAVSSLAEVKLCSTCHNISESEICNICKDPSRDRSLVCAVKDIRDVLAIESTMQFKGVYHVLGGLISPMEGIGPSNLTVQNLVERVEQGGIKEVICALSTTMEGDTTVFYIYKKLKPYPVEFSTLARGLAIGDELEYADEITLGRSLLNRVPYENHLIK